MASSESWKDLAEKFRAIPEAWTLTAEWNDPYYNGIGEWSINGSRTAKYKFEALATRAGREIAKKETSNLLTAWLNELKREHFGYKEMGSILTSKPDEPEVRYYHSGRIPGVCGESANFCNKLEARAVQAESDKDEPRPDFPSEPKTVPRPDAIKATSANRAKKQDLRRYLDAAKLTDRQYKCASLKWEYGLSISAIARELHLSRMTIDQHIKFAQKKFDASGMYEKMRKQLARTTLED